MVSLVHVKLISSVVICSTNFPKWEPSALREANPRSNCVIINFILVLDLFLFGTIYLLFWMNINCITNSAGFFLQN